MSTEAKSSPSPVAAAILVLDALASAPAQTGKDDDTDYDHYDVPSGNIWRPISEPGQPPAVSPSLIVRTWHHRPGRGSVRPDKETP
jgi:hypothetical protein